MFKKTLLMVLFLVAVFLFSAPGNALGIGSGDFSPLCGDKVCGPNTYCFEGECKCSLNTKNCDGNWENGCECGSQYTVCQGNQCVCQANFYDCDGNVINGCELSRVCPVCKAGETRVCNTTDVCSGKQTCDSNGYWGKCASATPRACTPYAIGQCSPIIDGKSCPALSGSRQCNSCGSRYGACAATADTICCPGSTGESCVVGTCAGVKACSPDGKSQGQCFSGDTLCCSKDSDCDDFNGCTSDKCSNNRCGYSPVEDCRGLTPVRCKTDDNCSSKDSCVDGLCTQLQCNDKFTIENHKCVCGGKECDGQCYFAEGSCCDKHWNEGFEGCSFDLGYYHERVKISGDGEAFVLLRDAENLAETGDIRKASVVAKIALVKAEIVIATESQETKNKTLAILNEAKELLSRGNYSLALDKADESLNLLSGKNVRTEVETNSSSLWQKNKVPIIAFSLVILSLLVFIAYIIFTPKI